MTIQQYFVVEANVVTNSVMWDGDTNTWQPPADATMLISATTPAMIWEYNNTVKPPIFELVEVIGKGDIGFIWNGTVLTTNEPQPSLPVALPDQPSSNGLQTA